VLTYQRSGAKVTVTVSPSKGSYPGQVERRSYVVELPQTSKPRAVAVNHKQSVADFDEATHTIRIRVAPRSIRDGVIVVASF
jgi:hypothetical protein